MPIFEPFFRQRRIIRRQITSIFSKILEKVLLILFAIIPIRCLLGKQSIVFDFIPHAGTQSEFFASFADSVVHPRRAARYEEVKQLLDEKELRWLELSEKHQ